MRIRRVPDRIRAASTGTAGTGMGGLAGLPGQALRAAYGRAGRFLLYADRLRRQSRDGEAVPGPDGASPLEAAPGPGARPDPAGRPDLAGRPDGAALADRAAGAGRDPAAGTEPAAGAGSAALAEPPAAEPAAQPGRKADGGAAPYASRWRSLDQTGNVRLLPRDEPAEDPPPPEQPAPPPEPAAPEDPADAAHTGAGVPAAEPGDAPDSEGAPAAAEDSGVPRAHAAPEAADLPVPNYDALSLPSLRARLRHLDVEQLRMLAEYERANAGRLDVVMMFERRIAKLAGQ